MEEARNIKKKNRTNTPHQTVKRCVRSEWKAICNVFWDVTSLYANLNNIRMTCLLLIAHYRIFTENNILQTENEEEEEKKLEKITTTTKNISRWKR